MHAGPAIGPGSVVAVVERPTARGGLDGGGRLHGRTRATRTNAATSIIRVTPAQNHATRGA